MSDATTIFAFVLASYASFAAARPPGHDASTLQTLRALGYVDTAPTSNPQDRGVTLSDPRAFAGLNLISSRDRASAHLADMDGKIVHRWSDTRRKYAWMHVELLPNGHIMAISKDLYVVRLDWQSNVLWRCSTRAHHDLAMAPNGRTYVLSRESKWQNIGGTKLPLLAEKILILSPNGTIERQIPLFELLEKDIAPERIAALRQANTRNVPMKHIAYPERAGDLLHANSIAFLKRPIRGIAPRGSVLLSIREMDRIVILNPAMTKVLWMWGKGELEGQHHATQLENGNILVFDNGTRRMRSRVLEVAPTDGSIAWSYSDPNFFTRLRGAAQKLPNGNVLATESDSGHALEVTPQGTIVWEFWNPDIRGSNPPQRAALYRLTRYSHSFLRRRIAMAGKRSARRQQ